MNNPIRVRAGAIIIENKAILLVEFNDENGLHYNVPGGGVEPEETVVEAVRREVREEVQAEVEVGPLAFVYEYAPHINAGKYGPLHSLSLLFDCKIRAGSAAGMPQNPDANQTGMHWIPLSQLQSIVLYPNIKKQIIDYAQNKRNIDFIEEPSLEAYDKD
mgnify:CR=1 FL=1